MKIPSVTLALFLVASSAAAQHQVGGFEPIGRRPFCALSVEDQGAPGNCLPASSVPTLGMLYPLSSDFNIDPSTGFVGIGTTTPAEQLHVFGSLRVGGAVVCARLSHPFEETELILRSGGGVFAGADHTLGSGSSGSVIGGGQLNEVYDISCVIGGGSANIVGSDNGISTERWATVSGGSQNQATSVGTVVGGGTANRAYGPLATVAGGSSNDAGSYASVAGGEANDADGSHAAIPGGILNLADGDYGFAAGNRAEALHDHAFVWSGSTSTFASTAPQQFLIEAPGGVGIGTNQPSAVLHVENNDLGVVVNPSGARQGIAVEATDAVLSLYSEDQGFAASAVALKEWGTTSLVDGWGLYRTSSSSNSEFRISYGTNENYSQNPSYLTIEPNGEVGIGTTNPSTALDVIGNVRATGYITTSDARLKTNVCEIDGALDKVRALRGVSFDWDRERLPEAEECRQLGFLAQEVREVLPDVVREDDEGGLAVAYTQLVPVLVEALKEQSREIAELRAAVQELRAE